MVFRQTNIYPCEGQGDKNAFACHYFSAGSAKTDCWPVQKSEGELKYSYRCTIVGWEPFSGSVITTSIVLQNVKLPVHVCSCKINGELHLGGWAASLSRVSQKPQQFNEFRKDLLRIYTWEAQCFHKMIQSFLSITFKNLSPTLVHWDSWKGS